MKQLHYTSWTLFFIFTILFASPYTVLASEGDDGHQLEVDVNGYHVTLASENDWTKGENNIIVTLSDGMGMPLRNADVEILIAPKSDGHAESETDSHGDEQQQESMSGMDMSVPVEEVPAHDEEISDPISMMELDEHGMYVTETHLESSGEHEVHVMFHANGEMLQANFTVEIPGTNSKTIVLWGFVMVNTALVISAGIMKKQSIIVKGGQ